MKTTNHIRHNIKLASLVIAVLFIVTIMPFIPFKTSAATLALDGTDNNQVVASTSITCGLHTTSTNDVILVAVGVGTIGASAPSASGHSLSWNTRQTYTVTGSGLEIWYFYAMYYIIHYI